MEMTQAVRELRAVCGESQQAFSNRLGIAINSVSRYETGESRPAPFILVKLGQLAREKGQEHLYRAFAFGTAASELGQVGREMLADLRQYLHDAKRGLTKFDLSEPKLSLTTEQKTLLKGAYDSIEGGLDFIKQMLTE